MINYRTRPEDMEMCKRVCDECPFAKDSIAGYLGPYEEPEELHRIVMHELPFSCHMKQSRDLGFEEVGTKRNPLCRGAMIYMKRNGKVPRNINLRKAFDMIAKEEGGHILSVPEFLKHHTL